MNKGLILKQIVRIVIEVDVIVVLYVSEIELCRANRLLERVAMRLRAGSKAARCIGAELRAELCDNTHTHTHTLTLRAVSI